MAVSEVEHDEAREPGEARASALLGLLMMVAAAVVLVDAANLRGSDAPVGPAAAPTLLGILLGLLGGALAVQARSALRTPESAPNETRSARVTARRLWRLAALVAILIAFALLLPILGYVVSATALFTGAALLLGAPHPPRVVAYGWTLAVLVFLIFDRLIGLTLPAGPWGF